MSRPITASLGLAALFLAAGPAAAQQEVAEACPQTLKMADTGIEGMGRLSEAFGPFSEEFERVTGVELEMYSLSDRTAAGNALRYDEVDLVFAGPSEFVLFSRLTDIEILFSIERPHYGSSFYAPADSDIRDLGDLEGKRVALKDAGSTSGHIIPSMMLVEAGLDLDDDLEIIMAGDARVAALVNGDVDAMGGGNRDIEQIREMDPDGDYRVIADSGALPGDPVVVRSSLPEDCRSALRETLQANADGLWEALIATERNEEKFLNRDSSLGFDLEASDYRRIEEAYAAAGIELE